MVKQNPSPVAPSAVRTVTSTQPTEEISGIDVPTGRVSGSTTVSVSTDSITLPGSAVAEPSTASTCSPDAAGPTAGLPGASGSALLTSRRPVRPVRLPYCLKPGSSRSQSRSSAGHS